MGEGLHPKRPATEGFTLIEILVVVAIIALMMGMLVPSLAAARLRARITIAHADLRQITTALDAYTLNNRDTLPPTYVSCMSKDVTYALPPELWRGRFLPRKSGDADLTWFPDVFDSRRSYKYRAPQRVMLNGSLMRQYSQIWVPADVPNCRSDEGNWYPRCADPTQDYAGRVDRCKGGVDWGAIGYAVWSPGPDAASHKFPSTSDGQIMEGEFPLRRRYWLTPDCPTGLITHFQNRKGQGFTSP